MAKLGAFSVIILNRILRKYIIKEELESTGSKEDFCEHGNVFKITVPSNELIRHFGRQTTASWKQ
jgi:hypothetical protein